MDNNTVILFTRNGLGDAAPELQAVLAKKFLSLVLESAQMPGKLLFYTDGVRLACEGSPVLEQLKAMEEIGVELVLCKTCLDTLGLSHTVRVGIVGGMGDILEALQKAGKVISV